MQKSNGLGRRHAVDVNDRKYLLKHQLRSPGLPSPINKKRWTSGAPYLDQGNTPHCVGFGTTNAINAAPAIRRFSADFAEKIYHRALQLDEFPGEADEGTSVRAGMKALLEQGIGCSYVWAIHEDGTVDWPAIQTWLLTKGVVVVGTSWYEPMFEPNAKNIIEPGGINAGGHCYAITGIDLSKKLVRIRNSWGKTWGENGSAWMSISSMVALLNDQGEAAVLLDVPAKKVG